MTLEVPSLTDKTEFQGCGIERRKPDRAQQCCWIVEMELLLVTNSSGKLLDLTGLSVRKEKVAQRENSRDQQYLPSVFNWVWRNYLRSGEETLKRIRGNNIQVHSEPSIIPVLNSVEDFKTYCHLEESSISTGNNYPATKCCSCSAWKRS